jgi:hypothetical protein
LARCRSRAFWARIAGDPFADRDFELHVRLRLVVEVGQRHPRQPGAQGALDRLQIRFFIGRHEGEGIADRFGARGASHPVDVVLRHRRHIEIDDVTQLLDVDPARGDVGRHQHAILAARNPAQRFGPLRLGPVAVDPLRLDALLDELLVEPIGAMLGAGEDQDLIHVSALEQRHQQRGLEILRHRIHRVGDSRGGRGLPLEADRHRVLQHVPGERHDRLRHRRAEEQGLPLGRESPKNPADVGEETHVEHPVRLVEHQHLESVEAGVGLPHVIEQPARCRNDHVEAAPERVLLRSHAHAAEDRGGGDRGSEPRGPSGLPGSVPPARAWA